MPATNRTRRDQSGFSLLELMIVLTVMLILTASVFSLVKSSTMISVTTYEMTEAQESLRTAQEYINRDLLVAGDGLRGMNNICLRTNFVTTFLTKNATSTACGANMVNLPLIQSDNDVPASTPVALTTPLVNVKASPVRTDRINILQIDRDTFPVPVTVAANAIAANGSTITVPAADIGKFNVGEIYFISTTAGATFGTVTAKNAGTRTLTFASGDAYGLNQAVNGGPISVVSTSGTLPASIMRMRIVHYFVDENGLLMRRIFGVNGSVGHTDSVIAEHVRELRFNYVLDLTNANGTYVQPVAQLTTSQQRAAVRQVQVTVITETAHALANGSPQQITMTTTTSVRNLQFREALQP